MKNNKVLRKSGVLVHPTSFPSPYGIGDLGKEAFNFIDFLDNSNQRLWQILPLGPTGYGDSPYQSFSSFAGQPLIISPEGLKELGLLNDNDFIGMPQCNPYKIDYGSIINFKNHLFKKAFKKFQKQKGAIYTEFEQFCINENKWLLNYALFMAIKDSNHGLVWTKWDAEISFPTKDTLIKIKKALSEEIKYYQFLQFIFYKQWFKLKKYANKKNIQIIGDIPIFVAFDSADVWSNKELFDLDEKGYPINVAGVPPDYFSNTGQLWGNPLYKWSIHKINGYSWWINRIKQSLRLVDILRIDHFRGFESYWAIPFGSKDAINGKWKIGPGIELFDYLKKSLGENLPIIAEDLGIITEEVKNLRDTLNFPGMKVLQFGFETLKDNDFLPHNFNSNSICYTGTHDNDTSLGWYLKASEKKKDKVRRYMNTDGMDVAWDFIRTCLSSVSNMAIFPIQDILSLNSEHRMNTPGIPMGNWQFRYTSDMLNKSIIERLSTITKIYGR